MRLYFFFVATILLLFSTGCTEKDLVSVTPKTMVQWATELVQNTPPAQNIYTANTSVVAWKELAGAGEYTCNADHSGLLTALLKVTYNYNSFDLQTWLGSALPSGTDYFQAIEHKDRFKRFFYIKDIHPNTVIAIHNADSVATFNHIMIVTLVPEEITPIAPIVGNTRQWSIRVVDSSLLPHSNDTRCDTCSGLGAGNARLYTDINGAVVGYSWSLSPNSTVYSGSQHHLAIGDFVQ